MRFGISPEGWGAQVNYDTWTDTFTPDDGIALHHGGSSDYLAGQPPYTMEKEAALLRSWERYHLSKGWRGLAYGWGVGQTGNVYRIRGWNRYGAHTGDVDGDGIANNDEIVPIIWIASGNHHEVTPAAHEAIVRLRTYIETVSPLATRLYGHREIQPSPTSCPGTGGMTYVIGHRFLEGDDMTTQEILDALGLKGYHLKTLRSLHRAFGVKRADVEGMQKRIIDHVRAASGGGLTEAEVKAIIANTDLTPPP